MADQDTILKVESILIELSMRTNSWSSRVQADRIIAVVEGTSTEKIRKPWEHFAITFDDERLD